MEVSSLLGRGRRGFIFKGGLCLLSHYFPGGHIIPVLSFDMPDFEASACYSAQTCRVTGIGDIKYKCSQGRLSSNRVTLAWMSRD